MSQAWVQTRGAVAEAHEAAPSRRTSRQHSRQELSASARQAKSIIFYNNFTLFLQHFYDWPGPVRYTCPCSRGAQPHPRAGACAC